MTQTDTPIAEMAERLSEAQRDRLKRIDPSSREMGGFDLIYDERGNYRSPALVERVGVNHPVFGSHWRLNALGLALRSHLMGGSDRGK